MTTRRLYVIPSSVGRTTWFLSGRSRVPAHRASRLLFAASAFAASAKSSPRIAVRAACRAGRSIGVSRNTGSSRGGYIAVGANATNVPWTSSIVIWTAPAESMFPSVMAMGAPPSGRVPPARTALKGAAGVATLR